MRKIFPPFALLLIFLNYGLSAQINLTVNSCNDLIAVFEPPEVIIDGSYDLILEKKVTPEVWASKTKSYRKTKIIFSNLPPGVYRVKHSNTNMTQSNERGNILVSNEVTVGSCLSQDVANQDIKIKLFPNPATENVKIEIPLSKVGCVAILQDVTGRKITTISLLNSENIIPLRDFSPGLYFVILEENKIRIACKKLAIK